MVLVVRAGSTAACNTSARDFMFVKCVYQYQLRPYTRPAQRGNIRMKDHNTQHTPLGVSSGRAERMQERRWHACIDMRSTAAVATKEAEPRSQSWPSRLPVGASLLVDLLLELVGEGFVMQLAQLVYVVPSRVEK